MTSIRELKSVLYRMLKSEFPAGSQVMVRDEMRSAKHQAAFECVNERELSSRNPNWYDYAVELGHGQQDLLKKVVGDHVFARISSL